MAKEITLRLTGGCVSLKEAVGGQSVLLHDYDCEGQDPKDLHVDADGEWYHCIRLFADGSERVILPEEGKSADEHFDDPKPTH